MAKEFFQHRRGSLATADDSDTLGGNATLRRGPSPKLGDRPDPGVARKDRALRLPWSGDHHCVRGYRGVHGVDDPLTACDGDATHFVAEHR